MSTMSTPLTQELNDYLRRDFSVEDDFLRTLNAEAEEAGIPAISIAPEQTAFLQILLKSINARTVVEVGSLAGYSAIVMARALPSDGTLIACEKDPKHADFIRRKVDEAGLSSIVTVLEGAAVDTLKDHPLLADGSQTIDAVFIDADKPNYPHYFDAILPLVKKGGLILADNVLWSGKVLDPQDDTTRALDAFNRKVTEDDRVENVLLTLRDGLQVIRKK